MERKSTGPGATALTLIPNAAILNGAQHDAGDTDIPAHSQRLARLIHPRRIVASTT
jgi:hypothetical protein